MYKINRISAKLEKKQSVISWCVIIYLFILQELLSYTIITMRKKYIHILLQSYILYQINFNIALYIYIYTSLIKLIISTFTL